MKVAPIVGDSSSHGVARYAVNLSRSLEGIGVQVDLLVWSYDSHVEGRAESGQSR